MAIIVDINKAKDITNQVDTMTTVEELKGASL